MRSIAASIALALLLLVPLASAAPLRAAAFCDTPSPPTFSWYNGPGVRCGVNLKSSTANCQPLAADTYVCVDLVSPGNVVLVGAAVPVDVVCGGSSDCWGVNVGFWGSGTPGGACLLHVEAPAPGRDFLLCS